MILVVSYDYHEQGTEGVIDWLLYYRANFIKITHNDFYENTHQLSLDVNEGLISYKGKVINDSISTVFFRRLFDEVKINNLPKLFENQLTSELTDEIRTLVFYLFSILRDKVWLPSPYVANVNKLIMLRKAVECGLRTPKSAVINNKKNLLSFFVECNEKIISKPISSSGYFVLDNFTYFANVHSLNKEYIEKVPDQFFPSFVQEKIAKEYEVRAFYLDGIFYSTAMIYSGDDQAVDVKIASRDDSSHWVPYELPMPIKAGIDKFMKSLSLNTGSIDLIKGLDGEYYFLEVNPVGQYGAPSRYGNFELERLIAEWLIKHDDRDIVKF